MKTGVFTLGRGGGGGPPLTPRTPPKSHLHLSLSASLSFPLPPLHLQVKKISHPFSLNLAPLISKNPGVLRIQTIAPFTVSFAEWQHYLVNLRQLLAREAGRDKPR